MEPVRPPPYTSSVEEEEEEPPPPWNWRQRVIYFSFAVIAGFIAGLTSQIRVVSSPTQPPSPPSASTFDLTSMTDLV